MIEKLVSGGTWTEDLPIFSLTPWHADLCTNKVHRTFVSGIWNAKDWLSTRLLLECSRPYPRLILEENGRSNDDDDESFFNFAETKGQAREKGFKWNPAAGKTCGGKHRGQRLEL